MSDTNDAGREQIGVPVGAVAETRPVTNHASKKVMLRAERKDTVLINGWFETEVVERQNGYYGPRLTLWCEDTGHNYELHGLSFDSGLLLWESVQDEDNFRTGWRKIGEVSAEISATKPYVICQHCELPIRSLQHERFSALGLCERMEEPNEWGKGTGDQTGNGDTDNDRSGGDP